MAEQGTKSARVDALLRAGKSVKDIAEELGVTDSLVYSRRKALRDAGALDDDGNGGGA